jgi:DNA-binding transcriptional regulator YiaG
MNQEMKKRIEKAGGRVTTVKEFMNLSEADMALIETKLTMTRALRELRERKNVTQVELARRMGTSQSRVAKIEAGDPTVSVDLILRALFSLGARLKKFAAVF